MDLIKEVAKDRLVIMVTHNPDLAERYSDRIIRFSDGKIIEDTHPHIERPKKDEFNLVKTSMSMLTALNLSFNNLKTKKGRTFLTAFASSIGIIGIAVILSLSTGFQKEIDNFQSDAMAEFPIYMNNQSAQIDASVMEENQSDISDRIYGATEYADTDEVIVIDSTKNIKIHKNNFSSEFIDYIEDISGDICSSVGYIRLVNMNLVREVGGKYVPVSFVSSIMSGSGNMTSTSSMGLSAYPESIKKGDNYLKDNYEIISGEYPKDENEIVLVVNTKNQLEKTTLEQLGFIVTDETKSISFEDIVGTEFKVIGNNEYYVKTEFGSFLPSQNYEGMYKSENGFTIKIAGIVRVAEGKSMSMLASGIAYSDKLSQKIIDLAIESDIIKAQEASDVNVMTMKEFEDGEKDNIISFLGGNVSPFMVMVFPKNFEAKDEVLDYIEAYNDKQEDSKNKITYTDLASTMSEMTSSIMDGITLVLVAFAAISLVVSMIMICIITYTSVIERTKEIGILKALGARKKDITRVFDAETLILGVFSGLLGVFIAWLCTFPINNIIEDASGLTNASNLQLTHALILVAVSTILTVLGGHIPAKMASKKDPVEALRSE